jgi:hypothetical protein
MGVNGWGFRRREFYANPIKIESGVIRKELVRTKGGIGRLKKYKNGRKKLLEQKESRRENCQT